MEILNKKMTLANKIYYQKNKNKENERCREYYNKNIIKQRKRCRLGKMNNREHYTDYMRNKRYTDLNFLLASRLRRRLLASFKSQGIIKKKESVKYGIDYAEIIDNLKNTIPKDYYKNPKKYCMDHIIPLSAFDLSKDSHIRRAQSKDNIQWLTVKENIQKRDKLNWKGYNGNSK
jgi:hypothetical protein